MSVHEHSDVLVVGGGPAGTTIAGFLAQQGWTVTLLEKAHHPRFHIGESLLPMNLPILERLGVLDAVHAMGVVKYGAEFNSPRRASLRRTFEFRHALDKGHPYAYQVKRAEFDAALFRNCQRLGVDAREGINVRNIEFRAGKRTVVHGQCDDGTLRVWETRFLVDASGRDTLLSRRLGLKHKNAEHGSAAIFGHFTGVERRQGEAEGNISLYWFQHGWVWMIPLREGVMSVGAVCFPDYLRQRQGSVEEFLWETLRRCPGAERRMRNASLIDEARATGNYSYTSRKAYGDGYLLVGDAFAFVDPVFSSGVYLAMSSAEMGAEVVDACLREPQRAQRLLRAHERRVRRGIKLFSWFIYRFTSPAMQHLFLNPRNFMRMEEAIVSMLAGDIFRGTPIRLPLMLFKVIYAATSAFQMTKSWRAYQRRARNARLLFSGGTTPQDTLD